MQGDIQIHIFIFLLNISQFAVTGIVLHCTEATLVILRCEGLWESMLFVLILKCIRLLVCSAVFKFIQIKRGKKGPDPLNLVLYTSFFVIECITTSRALNSQACLEATRNAFNGPPMISYVNGLLCVWDGCYVLSHVLYILLIK